MNAVGKGLIVFLSTGAFSGYAPVMPGTAGSVVGVGLFLLCCRLPAALSVSATVVFIFFAIWIANNAEKLFRRKDPPQVVIDEIAGYLVALVTFPPEAGYLLAGFVLFRFFDILKPFPIGGIDRTVGGGLGIVLDDVVAGIYANAVLQAARWLA